MVEIAAKSFITLTGAPPDPICMYRDTHCNTTSQQPLQYGALMDNDYSGFVLGAFVADSLALGAHWIYDTTLLDRTFGNIDHLLAPLPDSYHKTKKAGEFTHYGDQSMVLFDHLVGQNGNFDLNIFASQWRDYMSSYTGYLDRASKETLMNLNAGSTPLACGSKSTDLGGAARIAPIVFCCRNDHEAMMQFALEQTTFTHNGPGIRAGVEFLINSCIAISRGATPQEAFADAIDLGIADIDLDLRIRKAMEASPGQVRTMVQKFGQACNISGALPGAVYSILSHMQSFSDALRETVMAGGDSSARGMIVGMILGGFHGVAGIPQKWLNEMVATEKIQSGMRQLG